MDSVVIRIDFRRKTPENSVNSLIILGQFLFNLCNDEMGNPFGKRKKSKKCFTFSKPNH